VSMCVVSSDAGSGDAAGICLRGRELHSVCSLHAALLPSVLMKTLAWTASIIENWVSFVMFHLSPILSAAPRSMSLSYFAVPFSQRHEFCSPVEILLNLDRV
jgi:hypothetical protein